MKLNNNFCLEKLNLALENKLDRGIEIKINNKIEKETEKSLNDLSNKEAKEKMIDILAVHKTIYFALFTNFFILLKSSSESNGMVILPPPFFPKLTVILCPKKFSKSFMPLFT